MALVAALAVNGTSLLPKALNCPFREEDRLVHPDYIGALIRAACREVTANSAAAAWTRI